MSPYQPVRRGEQICEIQMLYCLGYCFLDLYLAGAMTTCLKMSRCFGEIFVLPLPVLDTF